MMWNVGIKAFWYKTFLQFRFGPGESMFDKQPGEKSTLERKVMCSCSQHTSIITKDKGNFYSKVLKLSVLLTRICLVIASNT